MATPEEIAAVEEELAAIQAEKARLTGLDVAKSLAVSPAKAAVGMVGLPKDVTTLSDMARGSLNKYLPDWMVKADTASRFLPTPGNVATGIGRMMPSSQDIQSFLENFTGKWYQPQTAAGRVADVAGQTATTFGRNILTQPARALPVIAGTAGGTELGRQVTPESMLGPLVGGIVGGGIPAGVSSLRGQLGSTLKESIGNVTPEEIAAARALFERSQAVGLPLLPTEALDRGHVLSSALLAHPRSANIMMDFMTKRPEQLDRVFTQQVLGQTGPRRIPSENAAVAEKAATEAIESAQKSVARASKPFYRGADKQHISESSVVDIYNQAMGIAGSDKSRIVSPLLSEYARRLIERPAVEAVIGTPGKMGQGRWIPGTPDVPALPARYVTDIENLDRIRKYYRDKMELPLVSPDAIPKEQAKNIAQLNVALQDAMKAESPAYAKALKVHETLSKQAVDPLLASGVGKIAGKGYDPAQFPNVARVQDALMNENVRPENIKTIYSALNKQEKQAFPGMVQTTLENQLSKAITENVGGPVSTAPAKLAVALAGNPNRMNNLEEMMRGVAQAHGKDPEAAAQGVRKLMEMFKLTGRTPAVGSQTYGRGEVQSEMGRTYTRDIAGTISLTPAKPWARRVSDWIVRGRFEKVAEAMTSKDGLDRIIQLAKLEPKSISANYIVSQMLGIEREKGYAEESK